MRRFTLANDTKACPPTPPPESLHLFSNFFVVTSDECGEKCARVAWESRAAEPRAKKPIKPKHLDEKRKDQPTDRARLDGGRLDSLRPNLDLE
jgi:hypothetical protein